MKLFFYVYGLLFVSCFATPQQVTPRILATRVANQALQHPNSFLQWDYGSSIIIDALWQFADTFNLDITDSLNKVLDEQATNPNNVGYKVLHDIDLPWESAVGDHVGLFPIAYLSRADYYAKHPNASYTNTSDIEIATKVAAKYVYAYPLRLADNTYSRTGGWDGQPTGGHPFVWSDDQYMGLTLLARLAKLLKNRNYMDSVAQMEVTYAKYLEDVGGDHIFWHGYNNINQDHNCCKWGRANGWAMLAHVEVLKAFHAFPTHPLFESVLSIFQRHSQAMLRVQDPLDGRWHEVLDMNETFLETSATAMFLWCYIEGVNNGWLDRTTYEKSIRLAWSGLQKTITTDGIVNSIVQGTGIGPNWKWYNERPTPYLSSAPGLGSVFLAINAMEHFTSPL